MEVSRAVHANEPAQRVAGQVALATWQPVRVQGLGFRVFHLVQASLIQ